MAKLITFHIPDDQALLAAMGEVAVLHEHMNYALRMTLKTLAGITPAEAIAATKFESSRQIRDRVRKLARKKLGEGAPLLKLQAILTQSKSLTEKRNDLIHGVWAEELDGEPHIRDGESTRPLPTVQELKALAAEIEELTKRLYRERLSGFLKAALGEAQKHGMSGRGDR